MKLAQIILPAILVTICKSQLYEPIASVSRGTNGNGIGGGGASGDEYDSDEPLVAAQTFYKHLDAQQKSEQLIEQYRFLIAKTLLRLKDACKVYELLMCIERFDDSATAAGGCKEQVPDTGRYLVGSFESAHFICYLFFIRRHQRRRVSDHFTHSGRCDATTKRH